LLVILYIFDNARFKNQNQKPNTGQTSSNCVSILWPSEFETEISTALQICHASPASLRFRIHFYNTLVHYACV
jgi:hypothetical protein